MKGSCHCGKVAYTADITPTEAFVCATCGCAPFSRSPGPDGKPRVMVNLRCAEDVDLATIKLIAFDGATRL